MSDNWIRLIPTSATWEPEAAAAEAATAYVASLFAAPGDSADEVVHEFYGQVAFIDSGVNTASSTCRACGRVTGVDWILEVIDARSNDLRDLKVTLPCCGVAANLNELDYDWPMGFALFEIGVLNGTRGRYELDATELEQTGAILGHPVRQVLAPY